MTTAIFYIVGKMTEEKNNEPLFREMLETGRELLSNVIKKAEENELEVSPALKSLLGTQAESKNFDFLTTFSEIYEQLDKEGELDGILPKNVKEAFEQNIQNLKGTENIILEKLQPVETRLTEFKENRKKDPTLQQPALQMKRKDPELNR
ncbi:MAG: hypothetical protein GXO50_04165 [Chlorobi bacterium]|nr:hypothetical protein [Chlorobiota bacterium]